MDGQAQVADFKLPHTSSVKKTVLEVQSFLDFKKACTTSEFPNKFSRHVLEKGPVYQWPNSGFHVVTNRELAKIILTSDSYTADREMAASAGLEDSALAGLESKLKETFQNLLAKAFSKTQVEFVSEIANELQSTVGQTTADQICNTLFLIAEHSDIQTQLRLDSKLIPAAIEECKRFDPAVTFLSRIAKEDTRLGTYSIAKGETVFVSNHAINRDPAIENPFRLDIHRQAPKTTRLADDGLDIKLSRLQMNLFFELLLTEFPFFWVDRDRGATREHYSLASSGFLNIYLETV